ncbi:glycoside hydrolase family 53 protein [Formosa sp. S-31]|uniref:glycoside hydrolase family 53 protein n=1 Tax=Formosa sp. S-31 TaxID=2790949 RepID=UPI003EB9A01A
MNLKHFIYFTICCFVFTSCNSTDDGNGSIETPEYHEYISAVDISSWPEIETSNPTFYDAYGNTVGFITQLKSNGVNTVRLRLWVNPLSKHSGFDEVKTFATQLRTAGFKIWLSVHYSDNWADPEHQNIPESWQGLSFSELKEEVGIYTKMIVQELQPEYIQIGNEINLGFLLPQGDINTNYTQFKSLMETAITSVRNYSSESKIIFHFAGLEHADWFFGQVNDLDYDIIGLSYYPIWHGKSLTTLQNTMASLSSKYDKDIVIAETAYPFTLDWNDWTNNIVGQDNQLITTYPATPEGQLDFVNKIKTIAKDVERGIGFCYWGAELIAWKGDEATDGSPWENQAIFDFNNKALPVLEAFLVE